MTEEPPAEDDSDDEARRLVLIERVKLTATFINTIASGSVLAGIVIPMASLLSGAMPDGTHISAFRLGFSAIIWLFTGAILHSFARRLLGNIDR